MDLEKLGKAIEAMGFKPKDAEYKRLMDAAVPVEVEDVIDAQTSSDASDELADARVAQAAAEAEASGLRTLLEEVRSEITTQNERIGNLDGFRSGFEARYGVLTSDGDESDSRTGNVQDEPLASDEEFKSARSEGYDGCARLFTSIMSRWKGKYGDAAIPADAAPTTRSLSFVRRSQATQLPGEAPSFR